MKHIIHSTQTGKVVEIVSEEVLIQSEQDALDLMANCEYQYDTRKIIIHKENISKNFFELKTGLAGAVLQKFVNYKVLLAIIGDFSGYNSKSLKDFIYECNQGNHILFLPDVASAMERIS
jgi:hypothetical protein